MKADALPPVALQRRGAFEMVPDFLKKETKKDLANIAELDMMSAAFEKQDKFNQDSGPSMSELFRQKTEKMEKELKDKEMSGMGKKAASEQEV